MRETTLGDNFNEVTGFLEYLREVRGGEGGRGGTVGDKVPIVRIFLVGGGVGERLVH